MESLLLTVGRRELPCSSFSTKKHITAREGNTNQPIQLLQVVQSADGYPEEITVGEKQSISADQWLIMLYVAVSAYFLPHFLSHSKRAIQL